MCATRIPSPDLDPKTSPLPVDEKTRPLSAKRISGKPTPPASSFLPLEMPSTPLADGRKVYDISTTQKKLEAAETIRRKIFERRGNPEDPDLPEIIQERQKIMRSIVCEDIKFSLTETCSSASKSEKLLLSQTYINIGLAYIHGPIVRFQEREKCYSLVKQAQANGDNENKDANWIIVKYIFGCCGEHLTDTPFPKSEIRRNFKNAQRYLERVCNHSPKRVGARMYMEFAKEYLRSECFKTAYKSAARIAEDINVPKSEVDYYLLKLRVYGFEPDETTSTDIKQEFARLVDEFPEDDIRKDTCRIYQKRLQQDVHEKKDRAAELLEHETRPALYSKKTQDSFCHRLYDDIGRDDVVVDSEHIRKVLEKTSADVNARLEGNEVDKLTLVTRGKDRYYYAPTLLLKAIESCNYDVVDSLIKNGADPLEIMECRKAFIFNDASPLMNEIRDTDADETILCHLAGFVKTYLFKGSIGNPSNKAKLGKYKNMQKLVFDHIKKTNPATLKNSETGETFGSHLHWYIDHFSSMAGIFGSNGFEKTLKNENNVNAKDRGGNTPLMLLCNKFLSALSHSIDTSQPQEFNENEWELHITHAAMPYYTMLKKLLDNNQRDLNFGEMDNHRNTVMSMITNYYPPTRHREKESAGKYKGRDEFSATMRKCLANMLVKYGADKYGAESEILNKSPVALSKSPKIRKDCAIKTKDTIHKIPVNKPNHTKSEIDALSYLRGGMLNPNTDDAGKDVEHAYNVISTAIGKMYFERNGNHYQHPFPIYTDNFEGVSMKGITLAKTNLTGFNLSGAKDLSGGTFDGACYLKDKRGETVLTLSSKGYDNFKPSNENLRNIFANPNPENYEKLALYALLHPNMLETTHENGFNALREAARSGDGYFVNIVLGAQPDILDPGVLDENGHTPLMSFISKAKEANDVCETGIRGLFHYMQYAAYSGELYDSASEEDLTTALTKTSTGMTARDIAKECRADVAILFAEVTGSKTSTSPLPLTVKQFFTNPQTITKL